MRELTDKEIEILYAMVKSYYERYLKQHGVKMPKLKNKLGKFTRDALVLVYLSQDYPNTREVTKEELTDFVRLYYPSTNDVQQARHLGAQKGWWIVAGGRDNMVLTLKRGVYRLYTLEEPYPGFKVHRITNIQDWESLKRKYNFRCATCGSKEGEPHYHWHGTITKLQKAHMDPNKPLEWGNIIPQCQKCNRADRNRWVYDEKGRVIRLADANFVKNFDLEVRKKIYRILYNEFKGINPREINETRK